MIECPTCHKYYKNYRSFHRHKSTIHPEQIKQVDDRVATYNHSPVLCEQCNAPLPYNKRRSKFCNHSCAALFNNQQRDYTNARNTWRQKLGQLRSDLPLLPRRRHSKECPTCHQMFIGVAHQKYCAPTCNLTKAGKIQYRTLCTFTLNPTDHAHLYKFDLIKTNGWYTPANKGTYNPGGVTWDHLYRVEDGFVNHVSPEIMSHPANAEMVTWKENIARKTSKITLNQLLERIRSYNQETKI